MSHLKYLAFSLVAGLVLSGCNETGSDSGSDENSVQQGPEPQILNIGTNIRTNSSAFSADYSVTIQYVAELADTDGIDDIVLVEVIKEECGCTTVIHDTRAGTNEDEISEEGVLVSANYYTGTNPDAVIFDNYKLRVVDSAGNETTQDFEPSLLEPTLSADAGFVYSERYSGDDTSQGYPGLALPTNITGSIQDGGYVNVKFDLQESRAVSAYIWFCTDTGVLASDVLLATDRLVIDGTTDIQIQWSVIEKDNLFSDYKSASGAGVQLFIRSETHTAEAFSYKQKFSSITECVPL